MWNINKPKETGFAFLTCHQVYIPLLTGVQRQLAHHEASPQRAPLFSGTGGSASGTTAVQLLLRLLLLQLLKLLVLLYGTSSKSTPSCRWMGLLKAIIRDGIVVVIVDSVVVAVVFYSIRRKKSTTSPEAPSPHVEVSYKANSAAILVVGSSGAVALVYSDVVRQAARRRGGTARAAALTSSSSSARASSTSSSSAGTVPLLLLLRVSNHSAHTRQSSYWRNQRTVARGVEKVGLSVGRKDAVCTGPLLLLLLLLFLMLLFMLMPLRIKCMRISSGIFNSTNSLSVSIARNFYYVRST